MSDGLPEGWAQQRLDAVTSAIQYGYTASAAHGREGVRLLRITDIQDGRVDWAAVPGCEISTEDTAKYQLVAGDIVFARSGATTGKSFLIKEAPPAAVFASYLIRVRPKAKLVESAYLARFFQSPEYWGYVTENVAGNAQPNCNGSKLAALELPLPPLAEQRRIVAKVEALLARVSAARERLEKVPLLMKRFRQSVLAKAFRGELVPTEAELAAREGRSFQSAHELLGLPADSVSDELPEGWASTPLGHVATKLGSGSTPRGGSDAYVQAGVPLIRSMNVHFDGFRDDGLAFLTPAQADGLREVTVHVRDVLLNITGASIGRVTIAPERMEGARVNQHVFIIRPNDALMPEFLRHFLASPIVQRRIWQEEYGVTRQALTKAWVSELEVPIAPFAEQRRIVAKIDALLAVAAKVEAEAARQLKVLARAPQAILQKAFSGELVPTEAELARAEGRSFESASELLGRINRTESALEPSAPRRGRRPRVAQTQT